MSVGRTELVLLDLDGTLVDTLPDLAAAINQALARFSIPSRDISSIRSWMGNGMDRLLYRALGNGVEGPVEEGLFNEAYKVFLDRYTQSHCCLSRCYPGVREGLGYLQEKQISYACVSNKYERFVCSILKQFDLFEGMRIVIGGDTLSRKKPDPLPLLYAASVLDKRPERSLMIGDSRNDVEAARSAGFQAICVSYGYHGGAGIHAERPDRVIDSLAQLSQLI